jgi:putative sigma-54 modulation protein
MKITVRGKNLEVTDALKKYAEKKVEKLGKYLPGIKEAIVTQSVQKNMHIVEVTLEGDGLLLRGEERTNSLYASIDQVVEKLETQIKRYKGRITSKIHQEFNFAEDIEQADDESPATIVRSKKFTLKPMSPDEAAMQMELVNHDFYLFMNADTNLISVIYKRKDGNYGLLEPDI